jgi:hypothetical protein
VDADADAIDCHRWKKEILMTEEGQPLQAFAKFYCDVCREPIEDVARGYVVWKHVGEHGYGGFKIVHQKRCDNRDEFPVSKALQGFLGLEGMVYLQAMLSAGALLASEMPSICRIGPEEMDDFIDFWRRVQLPHYEEARRRFGNPVLVGDFAGSNEVLPYMPDVLVRTIGYYPLEE